MMRNLLIVLVVVVVLGLLAVKKTRTRTTTRATNTNTTRTRTSSLPKSKFSRNIRTPAAGFDLLKKARGFQIVSVILSSLALDRERAD
jgi:hypothetical protein